MRRIVALLSVLAVGALAPFALGAATHETELYADLSGSVEVPDPGAPNGKGTAEVKLDDENGMVCWQFRSLTGLEGKPLLAHIHKGKAGKAGDVVVDFGPKFKKKGCVEATAKLIRAIVAKPGNYYVNVHTDKYPGGVVRGQLEHSEE